MNFKLDSGQHDASSKSVPTGTAAFAIEGKTLRALLSIPVTEQVDKSKDDFDCVNMENTKSIAADDFLSNDDVGCSILYTGDLAQLSPVKDHSLLKATENEDGGCSILYLGDLAQLSPVKDSSLFRSKYI